MNNDNKDQSSNALAVAIALVPKLDKNEKLESFNAYLWNNTQYEFEFKLMLTNSSEEIYSTNESVFKHSTTALFDLEFLDLDQSLKVDVNFTIHTNNYGEKTAGIGSIEFSKSIKIGPKILQTEMRKINDTYDEAFVKTLVLQTEIFAKFEALMDRADTDADSIPTKQDRSDKSKTDKEYDQVIPNREKGSGGSTLIIDLHAEILIKDLNGLSPTEIMHIQLEHVNKSIDRALVDGYKELVFIHGGGKGRLKSELFNLLRENSHVDYFENSYDPRFGFGATGVFLQ